MPPSVGAVSDHLRCYLHNSYFRRMIATASPGAQQRFIETFDQFFQAVHQQASDRANDIIPDLETYIQQRRDTSGCRPCWALIEYANNLDIPEEVMDHPIIRSLGEAANDLVTWSNVRLLSSFIIVPLVGTVKSEHRLIPFYLSAYRTYSRSTSSSRKATRTT